MVKIIQTADLKPGEPESATERLWCYNGLDCGVTLEVFNATQAMLDPVTRATYEFSKSLQGPILEMNMRGMLVDRRRRDAVIIQYEADVRQLESQLDMILHEGVGIALNWRSPAQLKHLFYEVFSIPPIKKRNPKGGFSPTVDRGALEKLNAYFLAQPIVGHLLALRDIAKKIGVLKTRIDNDGRIRTSFNIGGTTTGRLASSLSDFGTGTNMQNIEQRLRSIFVADPGYKLAYIDLPQAESRAVAGIIWNLFDDGVYLDACESGDLHTTVCKLAWQHLPWTGDLGLDKEIAERPFYRQHTYRHMAKVLGHGTNYYGQPFTMASHTKLPEAVIADFQPRYFRAFPGIPRWHKWVKAEIEAHGQLTSLTGRRRHFWGRRDDPSTLREAIAYDPQGSVGDILNTGMLRLWRANIVTVLLQIHDAVVIQYPEEREDELIPKVLDLVTVPVELRRGRTLVMVPDVEVGWNWAKATATNVNGLVKYKGHDNRHRVGFLDEVY